MTVRNPFSLEDVPDPVGADVGAFAASVTPVDLDNDDNAIAWVAIATNTRDVEGAWSARMRGGDGPWRDGVATVHRDGDRVFILYKDASTYLIEAEVRGDRWVGRYRAPGTTETSPWVGIVVSPYRIDGYWAHGRLDFRRCSPDERPEPIVAAVLTEARKLGPAELRELLGFARYLRWRNTDKT